MSPNRRSKTSRGFVSGGIGVVGAAPGEAVGVGAAVAGVAVADRARVVAAELERRRSASRRPICCAAIWSTEMPFWMSAPAVLLRVHAGQVAGRRRARGRPARRRARSPLWCARPGEHQHVARGTARAASGSRDTRSRAPAAFGVQSASIDAVGHVGEGQAHRRLPERGRGEGRRHGVEHGSATTAPMPLQERAPRQVLAAVIGIMTRLRLSSPHLERQAVHDLEHQRREPVVVLAAGWPRCALTVRLS